MRESIVSKFTSYKHAGSNGSIKQLLWKVNLRITGCIFDGKRRGWLYFFSEIEDQDLLHQLDHFVQEQLDRFKIKQKAKKFTRSFFIIRYNKPNNQYIPNFDEYSFEEKKAFVRYVMRRNVSKMEEETVERLFHGFIYNNVKDIEEDIGNPSEGP